MQHRRERDLRDSDRAAFAAIESTVGASMVVGGLLAVGRGGLAGVLGFVLLVLGVSALAGAIGVGLGFITPGPIRSRESEDTPDDQV